MVWEDYRSGTSLNVYAQRISAIGVVQWTTDGVAICTAANDQAAPQLVSDGSGGAIMVWHDARNGIAFDIYAQRVNGVGMVQWTLDGVAVCTEANDRGGPQIVSDGSDGAIMVWEDYRTGFPDLYVQRINGAGAVQWPMADGVAISTTTDAQAYSKLVPDGSGGAIIVWADFRSGTSYDIYAQAVSASGLE